LSIKEVAYKVGYEFPASLSKAFKQLYKISPSDYRLKKGISVKDERVMRIKKESIQGINYSGVVVLNNINIIYNRLIGPYNELKYLDGWKNLLEYAKERNVNTNRLDFIVIYHNDIDLTEASKLRSDVCISVDKIIPAGGKIGVKEIIGGKYAVFTYKGPLICSSEIMNSIFKKWELDNRYELRELPIFEKYLNNPMKTKPDLLNKEIYLPIQ